MFYTNCFAIFIFLIFLTGCMAETGYKQEAAKINYVNDKYMKNTTIFTYRLKRNSPYLTSINGTILNPWGNNITVMFEYSNIKMKSDTFVVETKVCDILKKEWALEFIKTYSDVPLNRCPVPQNNYHFVGIELPPKNFPLPVSQGDYLVKFKAVATSTKESILEIQLVVRFQNKLG